MAGPSNALQSLFGGKTKRQAIAGNVGGQIRVQEVLSPAYIIDAADTALGGIHLDPCASSDPSEWFAKVNLSLPPEAVALEKELLGVTDKARKRDLTRLLRPYYLGGSLKAAWPDGGTYINPPFGWLKAWLARVVLEAALGRKQVCLWPIRTHRDWWVRGHDSASEVVFLNYDVRFKGHVQAFPAPLVLVAWNCRIPNLGKRENGRWKP